MIKLNNKVLNVIVNFFLLIWQCIQVITGLIGLAVFRNCELYHNEDAGITVLKVNKGHLFGNACFSSGPIIFVTPNCDEDTIKHETGHSWQSIFLGPFFHIIISLLSVPRFWIRRWFNKSHDWYLSFFPEGGSKFGAEELGKTKRSQLK